MSKVVIVFDLDDTLYQELDYLKSAFKEIANYISNQLGLVCESTTIFNQMMVWYKQNKNVFKEIENKYNSNFSVSSLVQKYRNHEPSIFLEKETIETLMYFKSKSIPMGLITDGRSKQQRSKIEALRLFEFIDYFVISEEFGTEKPNPLNYQFFEDKYNNNVTFVYVGDNLKKDFISPNKLGWTTVCLKDKGYNIHSQNLKVAKEYQPAYFIDSLKKLIDIIK